MARFPETYCIRCRRGVEHSGEAFCPACAVEFDYPRLLLDGGGPPARELAAAVRPLARRARRERRVLELDELLLVSRYAEVVAGRFGVVRGAIAVRGPD